MKKDSGFLFAHDFGTFRIHHKAAEFICVQHNAVLLQPKRRSAEAKRARENFKKYEAALNVIGELCFVSGVKPEQLFVGGKA